MNVYIYYVQTRRSQPWRFEGDEDEEDGRRVSRGCRAERVETKSVMLSLDRRRGKGEFGAWGELRNL